MDGVDDLRVREAKIINLEIKGSFFELGMEILDDKILEILSHVSFEFRGQEDASRVNLSFRKSIERGFTANVMIEYIHHVNEEE